MRTTSTVLDGFQWNFTQLITIKCRCAWHVFPVPHSKHYWDMPLDLVKLASYVGRSQNLYRLYREILWCELLPQFSMDFNKTSHNWSLSWVGVHDIIFLSFTSGTAELCALGLRKNSYTRENGTWEFVMRTTSTVLDGFHWNFTQFVTIKYSCAWHIFFVAHFRHCRVMGPWTYTKWL